MGAYSGESHEWEAEGVHYAAIGIVEICEGLKDDGWSPGTAFVLQVKGFVRRRGDRAGLLVLSSR